MNDLEPQGPPPISTCDRLCILTFPNNPFSTLWGACCSKANSALQVNF